MTRHLTLIAALTSALALAACDTGNEESTAGAKTNADSQQSSAAQATTSQDAQPKDDEALDAAATLVLDGTISAPENVTLPTDADIHVQLIDVTLEDGSAKLLTEETFDANEVALPLPFTLKMPSQTLDDDHRQVLQAEVRDADDRVVWSTAEPEALALNAAQEPAPVTLVLEPVETAPNDELEDGGLEAEEQEIGQADAKTKSAETPDTAPEEA